MSENSSMSSTFRTNAIVLSSRDAYEADRYYSVLTAEHGKLELRARGARKISAKLSAHLEPFALCDLMIVRGRYGDIVAGVERLEAYPTIRNDADKMSLALQTLHLVDIGTKLRQEDQLLFSAVQGWMRFLNRAPSIDSERSAFISAGFMLKLLSTLGYRPELSRCVHCQKGIAPMGYMWHGLKGGVVCRDCTAHDPEQWFAARHIADDTLKLMRYAMISTFEDLLLVRLPGPLIPEFHDLVESLVIAHFPIIPALSIHGFVLASSIEKNSGPK